MFTGYRGVQHVARADTGGIRCDMKVRLMKVKGGAWMTECAVGMPFGGSRGVVRDRSDERRRMERVTAVHTGSSLVGPDTEVRPA